MNRESLKFPFIITHPGKILPWILAGGVFALTAGTPFFWDTLQLASRHAHFFYENSFSSLFLPNDMDSGHIPAFGMYLALIWKIFGRQLLVSHLAMIPFIVGALFFLNQLANRFFPGKYGWLALLVIVADATLLAQFTLVSPDIWIACFFSMALWAFSENKKGVMTLAFVGLTLTSVRGMMIVAAFFVTAIILLFLNPQSKSLLVNQKHSGTANPTFRNYFRIILRELPAYLPAALLAATYLGIHYARTGWIGYHPDMPWFEHFERVSFSGFLRNIVVLGWRLTDQGRVFIWLAGAGIAGYALKHKLKTTSDGRLLIVLTLVMTAAFSYSALTYRNLAGHRYFIPLFLMVAMTVIYHLFIFVKNKKWLILILTILLAGEFSGNFWVYPDEIAKGWDASLAYLPYQHLRADMLTFMEERKITLEMTGTSFPNNIALKFIDLSDDQRSFGTAEPENEDQFRYLLWSNVFNDFPPELKKKADREWRVIREIRSGQVKMILYENPASAGTQLPGL